MKKENLIKIRRKYGNLVEFATRQGLYRVQFLRRLNKKIHLIFKKSSDKFKKSKVKIGNNVLFLDEDDSLGLSLNQNYEPTHTKLIKENVRKGNIVLDIGANIGIFTLLFAELVGSKGKVYAFEPDPTTFNILKKNVEINGYKNVILINKAVSNKKGKVKLFLCENNNGNHKVYDSKENRKFIEVDCIKLDGYFKDYKGKINFIKMDIEGSEPSVINGSLKILSKNNLKMLTEFGSLLIEHSGYSYKQYLNDLFNVGFKVYDIEDNMKNINTENANDLFDRVNPSNGRGTNLFCAKPI